jgi:hypothetical protein
MSEHQGFSVHYRISVGPQKGRKVFTLQMLQALHGDNNIGQGLLGKVAGFSLHAGVSAKSKRTRYTVLNHIVVIFPINDPTV